MSISVRTAADLESARRLLRSERFALCLTDMRLPDGDGLDLVAWIQEHSDNVPVAVITALKNTARVRLDCRKLASPARHAIT